MKCFSPVILTLLLFLAYSCKKSSGPSEIPKISVSRTSVSVGVSSGYTDTITIQSTVSWKAAVSPDAIGWLSLDVTAGKAGKTIVTMKVTKDVTSGMHSAAITITPEPGSTLKAITVAVSRTVYSLVWQKALGGSNWDGANAVLQTSDGGYISIGSTSSNDGDVTGYKGGGDMWIVKTDVNGTKVWQRCLAGSLDDNGFSIVATADGGYVAAGYVDSHDGDAVGNHGYYDGFVVKLDGSGNIVWKKPFGGSGDEFFRKVIATKDGGYLVSGETTSVDGDISSNAGGSDLWLLKLDGGGNKVWSKTYGGSGGEYYGMVAPAADGGYVLSGFSSSNNGDISGNHGNGDIVAIKVDANGSKVWSRSFGGSQEDETYSISATTDGGYVLTGMSASNDGDVAGNHGGDYDLCVLKLDGDGKKQWLKVLGGSGADEGWDVVATSDGGFMVSADTESNDGDVNSNHGGLDAWMVKLDGSGNKVWQKTFGGTGDDYGGWLITTTDGGWLVAGTTLSNDGDVTGNHGGSDIWLMKVK